MRISLLPDVVFSQVASRSERSGKTFFRLFPVAACHESSRSNSSSAGKDYAPPPVKYVRLDVLSAAEVVRL